MEQLAQQGPGPGELIADQSLEKTFEQGFAVFERAWDNDKFRTLVTAILKNCDANKACVLIVIFGLVAIVGLHCYDQYVNIQLEYNNNILKRRLITVMKDSLQKTYDQLVRVLTNLHNQLMDALVHKKESLPDSASIRVQFEEIQQAQIKYYYIDHAKLNTEIDEAKEVLKIDKIRLQDLNKWAFRKLTIGYLTMSCMVWYMTGSWLNWQWFILGAIAVAVAKIAFGLMLRLLKLKEISSDINTFEQESIKSKLDNKDLMPYIVALEVSSSDAYPNVQLPNLRERGGQVEDAGPQA